MQFSYTSVWIRLSYTAIATTDGTVGDFADDGGVASFYLMSRLHAGDASH